MIFGCDRKAMSVNLSNLEKQLDELEHSYQEWAKPLDQFTVESLSKVNVVDGYTTSDLWKEMEDRRQQQLLVFDPCKNITLLLDQLCHAYLHCSSQEREQIRDAVCKKEGILGVLVSRIRESADHLRSSKNQAALLDGLIAASIENGQTDFRDVLLALAELYVAAEEAGIDPKPHFQAVAQMSSVDACLPDDYSTQRMLAEFHTFAVLRERKGEITHEEKAAMEQMVKKNVEEQLIRIQKPAPWWKRIIGRQ